MYTCKKWVISKSEKAISTASPADIYVVISLPMDTKKKKSNHEKCVCVRREAIEATPAA